MKKLPWQSQKTGFQESLYYLKGRQEGKITSFKTPWPKFNEATLDGYEWNTINVIGGRPGSGKTLIKDQLIREGIKLNCSTEQYNKADFPFRILEFQLEMLPRSSAIREYSMAIGKSYKYLCSADGKITDEDLKKCHDYAAMRLNYPIDIVEEPCTVLEFKEIIRRYMEEHKFKNDKDEYEYKKTIVTLDHSVLLKKDDFERDKFEMLNNLGEALTNMKKKYPIIFIILSQLNRNVDSPERNENGKYGNYILDSDIFGADALLQHADTLIGLNRPGKNKIRFFGPEKYIIQDDKVLVMHFLKCRNGDNRMSFFQAEFEKMRITEMAPPPKQKTGI